MPAAAQLIDVADQGAGTFEFLEHEFPSGRRFVIRDGKTRQVDAGHERRGIVEEYHKGLKTGCQIEDLQFAAVERLEPAIALLSAVALTLLNLRDASRRPDAHTRRATTLFAAEYVEVLSLWRHGKVRSLWTIHDFFFALARLGGH